MQVALAPVNFATAEVIEYRMRLSRSLTPAEATSIRGYFGNAYSEEVALHHHNPDGSLRYEYPRVQFKVLQRTAHLIGVDDASALVTKLWAEVDQARIGEECLPVLEASLVRRRERLGGSPAPIRYRFLTPWLGLNQNNHLRYQRSRNDTDRHELMKQILIGNCLSVAKAFHVRVRERLVADATELRPICARLKGVPMNAFIGTFSINFHLPNFIGIGKSVSRGFGTVERLAE